MRIQYFLYIALFILIGTRGFLILGELLEIEQSYMLESEHYSHSLRSIRALGRVSLDVIPLTSDVPEVQEAWTDFVSALEENIATDPELSEKLTFNPLRFHDVTDGHVVDRTGRRTIDLVITGKESSMRIAESDERMWVQVERDEGDEIVALEVDNLVEGEMLATISMDPKEALHVDKDYWEGMGYREGMAVLQVYYRTRDGLLAGAYAIKDSNEDDLREQFAHYGVVVPESENCNRWTRHNLKINLDEDAAKKFGNDFVKSYRVRRGLEEEQLSTTEFIRQHELEVQSYFDVHIVPVASSMATGRNNEATKSLASSLHQHNANKLSSNERSQLLRIANSEKFSDDDARFMESKIRYSLIEHLRPKLKQLLVVESPTLEDMVDSVCVERVFRTITEVDYSQLQQMNMHLTFGLGRGVEEKRSYGGCSSSKTEGNTFEQELGLQGVFGGKTDSEGKESAGEEDEFGSLEFKCTKGHTNKRQKGGWVYECSKCGEDVSCGRKP